MWRSNYWIGRNKIIDLGKKSWKQKHHKKKDTHKKTETKNILDSIISMKNNLIRVRGNAEGVIGPGLVQEENMKDRDSTNDERNQEMEGKEASKCWGINREPTPKPNHDRRPKVRKSRKKVSNNCSTPK